MKEQLYTIPVHDAFEIDCECPVCTMYKSLQDDAINFTMGPSYMEDDVRMTTDKIGFCDKHVRLLYENQNRLGLALMLNTHMKRTIQDIESLSGEAKITSSSFFRKKNTGASSVTEYIHRLNTSCFVCDRIDRIFDRYLVTIFYCYKSDEAFRKIFRQSKGFCTRHYGDLYEMAPEELSGSLLQDFLSDINKLYLDNMKRVQEDLEWFTDKFDYRNQDAPWKNSKDALPRSMTKINSVLD